jgi:hypothetical protein
MLLSDSHDIHYSRDTGSNEMFSYICIEVKDELCNTCTFVYAVFIFIIGLKYFISKEKGLGMTIVRQFFTSPQTITLYKHTCSHT